MTIPLEANNAFLIVQKLLAKSLIAVYLHGSAVVGGLRPRSDVDLLVVIDQPMAPEFRQCLADELMKISGHYPFDPDGRRPLEVIVFLYSDLTASRYPTRCEFIYGEWLRNKYEAGEIPNSICDPELTLVLAQSKQEAITLSGPKANSILPAISRSDIHHAIKDVLPTLIDSLQGDERNVLLTLARMWRTLVTGEFVSKDIAADWAITRISVEKAQILADARKFYLSVSEENWQHRQEELLCTVSLLHKHVLANLE